MSWKRIPLIKGSARGAHVVYVLIGGLIRELECVLDCLLALPLLSHHPFNFPPEMSLLSLLYGTSN